VHDGDLACRTAEGKGGNTRPDANRLAEGNAMIVAGGRSVD